MINKPAHFSQQYAEPFQDNSVAAAYRYRPPYPEATFEILKQLISTTPENVLDVGCGTGNIARPLVTMVDWVDAVDFSQTMLDHGRQLPHGISYRWWFSSL